MTKENKRKTNVFEKGRRALNALRNGKVFRAMMLSGLLLSQFRYPMDLVAKDAVGPNVGVENFEDTQRFANEIVVKCQKGDEELASFCRDVLLDLSDDNPSLVYLFSRMMENGMVFEVGESASSYLGQYFLGSNRISVPKNCVEAAMADEECVADLKNTFVHEGVHFLQDMAGIFNDCKRVSPTNGSALWCMTEMDAVVKSHAILEPELGGMDVAFEKLVDLVPLFRSYVGKGFENEEVLDYVPEVSEVVKKFNMPDLGCCYSDTEYVFSEIYNRIPEDVMDNLRVIEEDYNESLKKFEKKNKKNNKGNVKETGRGMKSSR